VVEQHDPVPLRERGNDALAEQAQQLLPDQVDLQRSAEILQRYGIDVPAVLAKLPWPLGAAFRDQQGRDGTRPRDDA